MPPRRRKNLELIAMLEMLLEEAESGLLDAAIVVFRCIDGSYNEVMLTDAPDDMVLEMRTAVIRLQCELARNPHQPEPRN